VLGDGREHLGPHRRLADDDQVVRGLEDHAEARADQLLVACDEHPDRRRPIAAGHGVDSSATTAKPPARYGPALIRPPQEATRSATQLTRTVAAVYDRLPPRSRAGTSIFSANYGEAGALARYGPALGLPAPLSGHDSYALWGPGTTPDTVVIAVGAVGAVAQLRQHFTACSYDVTFQAPTGS